MRVLTIGGSGHVGALLVPRLAALGHTQTLFDRRPPGYALPESVTLSLGDLTEIADLYRVLPGHDAVVYMAMGQITRTGRAGDSARTSFDANARGVWLACQVAEELGDVSRMVYASSLSVYENCIERPLPDERTTPADAHHLYGLTKRFGEECLASFCARSERLSGFSLRLCFPVESREDVVHHVAEGRDCALSGDETARAFHAALTAPVPPGRYAAVHVVGAAATPRVGIARAKELLGWEPDPKS